MSPPRRPALVPQPDASGFVEDFGLLWSRIGLQEADGRLLGDLVLRDEPATLDEMAAALRMSKSSVSVAARNLERLGLVRRLREPGSRRIRYEVASFEPMIERQVERWRLFRDQAREGAALVGPGPAKSRLERLAALTDFLMEEGLRALERWRDDADAR